MSRPQASLSLDSVSFLPPITQSPLVAEHPDAKKVIELEPMECPVPLVYHGYYVNVYNEPQQSYHNSFWASGHLLYLLGVDQVCTTRVLPWQDRLQSLVDKQAWYEALSLAVGFYDNSAMAVVGLPRKAALRKTTVQDKAKPILMSYLEEALKAASESKRHAEKAVREVIAVCIEFLVSIEYPELLFGPLLLGKFEKNDQLLLFFEVLEPYILNQKVRTVPAEALQGFVTQYKALGRLRRVELCVLNLEVDPKKRESIVDLDQLVKICHENSLLMALIYVCNNGLGDYTQPLEFMTAIVIPEEEETEAILYCGHVILTYLGMLFAGQALPCDRLPAEAASKIREELLDFLFRDDAALLKRLLTLDGERCLNSILYDACCQGYAT